MHDLILMIDNYDSFTFNLVQYLGVLGQNIKVSRNDKITIQEIRELRPKKIVISPGPGNPDDAGISKELIRALYQDIPILGVCLGHQCIGDVFGIPVINSKKVIHGKTSLVHHDGKTIFKGIKNPFSAARYHSLILQNGNIPDDFEISSETQDHIIMGIRHKRYPLEGVQFHPESFLTDLGLDILHNFLNL